MTRFRSPRLARVWVNSSFNCAALRSVSTLPLAQKTLILEPPTCPICERTQSANLLPEDAAPRPGVTPQAHASNDSRLPRSTANATCRPLQSSESIRDCAERITVTGEIAFDR